MAYKTPIASPAGPHPRLSLHTGHLGVLAVHIDEHGATIPTGSDAAAFTIQNEGLQQPQMINGTNGYCVVKVVMVVMVFHSDLSSDWVAKHGTVEWFTIDQNLLTPSCQSWT